MSMRVVISQPMYFPWVGMLEQMKLADAFVFYNDVQLTRGFFNRVQVKTSHGPKWMTVPIRDHHRGQLICDTAVDDRQDWRSEHRAMLRRAYQFAPWRDEMLSLVDRVFSQALTTVAEVSRASMMALAEYFEIAEGKQFVNSESVKVAGTSSTRLCDIVLALRGSVYVTGHGARNYLDHGLFERHGIVVEYMSYECLPYRQVHGAFTPYVTGLDLVANCGKAGANQIVSGTQPVREFVESR
jgi:hypothetical protein